MKLLIDLDSIIYKAGFSVEKTVRHVTVKGEDDHRASFKYAKDMKAWLDANDLTKDDVEIELLHEVGKLDHARIILNNILTDIYSRYPTDDVEMYMGGKAQYRYDMYPDYKANRVNAPKPVYYDDLFKWLRLRGAIIPKGIEADDAICIAAWKCINNNEDFVIARIDKDLAQIPGKHYLYHKQAEQDIDPWTADYNFYVQLLAGDISDHIPGVKGIGEVKAGKLLANCNDEREMYAVCREQWREDSGPTQMARSAHMLYLLRKEGDKWQPPV